MHVHLLRHNTSTYIYSTLLAFLMVWRTDTHELLSDFRATLKIHKKSNFDWNQLKLSTQHKYMYMYQNMY